MTSVDRITFDIQGQEEIASIQDFVASIFRVRTSVSNKKLWYRGHAKIAYELIPSVGRKHVYGGRAVTLGPEEEILLLHRFRRRAYPYVGRAMTAGEAIFLARHHGLPTRLLDWTANALYSLYFTCVHHQDSDGTVWAMLGRSDSKDLDAFVLADLGNESDLFSFRVKRKKGKPTPDDPSDGYALKIVHPFYNSPRLIAQDGAFTMHADPWHSIDSYAGKEFTKENLDIERLYSWHVPAANKVSIVKELSGLGITQRLVFPDLDGVARSLWETEVLWSKSAV